jgi:tetratricopeptide (TPR) repeat protein
MGGVFLKKILVGLFCILILSVSSITFAAEAQPTVKTQSFPAYLSQANEKIITHNTNVIASYPNDAIAYCKRGKAYNATRQDDLALSDFNKAIEINSRYAYAYYSRGLLYDQKGQYDLAINDFNKAIEVDSKYISVYYSLGKVYEENLSYQDAINTYRKVILLATSPQDQFLMNIAKDHIRQLGGTL